MKEPKYERKYHSVPLKRTESEGYQRLPNNGVNNPAKKRVAGVDHRYCGGDLGAGCQVEAGDLGAPLIQDPDHWKHH